jgi:hypothetical protein
MAHPKERDILRHLEMLARVKPSAESTDRAMDRVREQLLAQSESSQPSRSPRIISILSLKPAIKVAVAAIVVLTVSLIVVFWDNPSGDGNGGKPGPLSFTGSESAQYAARVRQEAAQIEAMTANLDARGLLTLLGSGLPESKVLIASKLGELAGGTLEELGHSRIIPALLAEAQTWTGSDVDNPFVNAVEQIQGQLAGSMQIPDSGASLQLIGQKQTVDAELKDILSGLVLDDQTKLPIANAWIEVLSGVNYRVQTDANGFYAINALDLEGNYQMRVVAPGYLLCKQDGKLPLVTIDPDTSVVRDFRLCRGCMIDVEVINEAGQAVKDVQLLASWLGSDHENDVAQPVGTDQDGRATVGAFEPSETVYMLTTMCDDFAPHHTNVKCSDPDTSQFVQIQVRVGQEVSGTALYEDGVPTQGLNIIAKPNWWHSKHWPKGSHVDDAGQFSLKGIVPGSYSIYALSPGQAYAMPVAQVKLPLEAGEVFNLSVPRESSQSLGAIDLHIQWQGQAQAGNVLVLAYSLDDTYVLSRKQIRQGVPSFTIDGLVPGRYALYFDGLGIREYLVEQVDVPGGPVELVLEYNPAPTISGLVVAAATGEPVDRFEVGLMKLRRLPNMLIKPYEKITAFAQADGEFSVRATGTGTYQLRVTADGFVPAWSEEISTDGDAFPIIEMVTGGRIQGRILDVSGQLVPGAKISQLPSDAFAQSAHQGLIVQEERSVVSSDGLFVLGNVPEGLHRLTVTAPRYSSRVLNEIEVLNGQSTESLDIVLSSSSAVEGMVYDADGQPEPDVALVVYDGSRSLEQGHQDARLKLATVVSDAQGFYRIERLPETMCYVERRKIDSSFGVVRRAIVPQMGQTCRLDMGQGSQVMGMLVVDGQAMVNQRILLADPQHPSTGTFQCYAQTDSVGSFVFRGVPIGRYALYYAQGAPLARWIRVETVQVDQQDLDVGVIPRALSTLAVELTSMRALDVDDWTVWLQQGQGLLGRPVGQVGKSDNGRVLVTQVPLGQFSLVARNRQGRHVRQALELTAPGAAIDISMTIPVGTASVSGKMTTDQTQSLLLFNEDASLIIRLDTAQESYAIADLPAGHYYLSNSIFGQSVPLETFDLSSGQRRVLDVDSTNWFSLGQGLLSVEVLTEQGHPLGAADVWLETPEGQIRPVYTSPQEFVFVAPVGDYTLRVTHPGFVSHQGSVAIAANDIIALYPERPVLRVKLRAP